MAKIKKSLLKDIKNAARKIKNQEAKENKQQSQNSYQTKLSHSQKRQIRKESLNDHKVKVTWNVHPGDLVKIKSSASPTGKELFGLVTWGIKDVIQRGPSTGWKKSLKSYQNNVRVMSSAGYLFFPANKMIVIS
jgi:hypothetical protein